MHLENVPKQKLPKANMPKARRNNLQFEILALVEKIYKIKFRRVPAVHYDVVGMGRCCAKRRR